MLQRFSQINDDLKRIYNKVCVGKLNKSIVMFKTRCLFQCREIGYEIHEEVLKVLHELHQAMKTLHTYQSEFRQAESRLQVRDFIF